MAAAAALRSITSSTVQPFTAAIASPTNGRYDGSLRTTAMGHRREERTVRFDQQTVERTARRGLSHVSRVLERHDPAERDVHAGAQALLDLVGTTREAMQHGSLGDALGPQHVEQIGPGVAGVDHQREIVRVRQPDLRGERRPLRVARRMLVVVVQPAFADRHHHAVVRRELTRQQTRPPRRRPRSPRAGAARWTPTPAGIVPSPAVERATATACCRGGGPVPMQTSRSMPAWAARARTGSRSVAPASVDREVLLLDVAVGVEPARHGQALRRGNRGSPFTTAAPPV